MLRAMHMQCEGLRVQGRLGFYAIVPTEGHGTLLVLSLPKGEREQVKHASGLVRLMVKEAISLLELTDPSVGQLNLEAIVATTTHMTKLHVPLLGWEHKLLAPADYVERAKRVCNQRTSTSIEELDAALGTKSHLDAPGPKEMLPILAPLDDSIVKEMCEDGTLVSLVEGHFDLKVKIAGAIEDACPHDETVYAEGQCCEDCGLDATYSPLEAQLTRRRCQSCDNEVGTDTEHCGECGKGRQQGNRMRYKCLSCSTVLCSTCNAEACRRRFNRERQAELLQIMKAGCSEEDASLDALEEIKRIVAVLPDEERYKPKSPTLMRVYQRIADEVGSARSRSERVDPPCTFNIHPKKFGGIEAVRMNKYRDDQKKEVLKNTMSKRGLQYTR